MSKTLALETGYGSAFGAYQGLSDCYNAELSKPRVSLRTTVGVGLGPAGAGVVIGTLIGL